MYIRIKVVILAIGIVFAVLSNPVKANGAALSSCKAIVGSIETAGSGGLSNGSGSVIATGSGLNIVVCDVDYSFITNFGVTNVGVTAFVQNTASNDLLCSFTSYGSNGNVGTSRTLSASGTSVRTLNFTINNVNPSSNRYYGFSCRLGQGDRIHGFRR